MKPILEKKTKIVATMGPVSRNKKVLSDMVRAGMNVARMNFSHGSYQEHKDTFDLIRAVEKSTRKPIAILQDLSGPKIRVGEVQEGVVLKKNDSIILTTKKCLGDGKRVFVNYKKLPKEVSKGAVIKVDDGKLELVAERVSGENIYCKVIVGGPLFSRKGVNLPNTLLSISSLTAKDKKDVLFGIEHDVDFIALSFVQTAKDIKDLKKILDTHTSKAKIIAKIETTEAVKNIDEITKPIKVGNLYLVLKINDKKESKIKIDFNKELNKLINFERNKQFNQFSLIFLNKIKQNIFISDQ